MKTRWMQWLLAFIVAFVFLIGGFTMGVAVERSGSLPGSMRTEPTELSKQFSVFWQSWELVQRHFVDRAAIDPMAMTYGAIDGMLGALGDTGHTRFMSPEDAAYQSSDIAGQFFGIGAELNVRDGYPIIVAPLDDSPAQKAGIKAGDVVTEVDGQSVAGMSVDKVVKMVRGPEGTPVTLRLVHPGESSVTEITIVRARIQIHPVSWAMIPGTQVAHLRLSQFNANASKEMISALKEIKVSGATAMVVDIRSNTGGLLDQCLEITSQFLSKGNVLVERDADGSQKEHPVTPGGLATEIPLVVMVNRGTASAAEILAGAIQDQKRGPVVGETTFGTGTVLSTFRLSDGSALLLGTSEWLTPNGRQIWKHGIVPDVTVTLPTAATPLTPKLEGEMTADQVTSSTDTQLLKALEMLR